MKGQHREHISLYSKQHFIRLFMVRSRSYIPDLIFILTNQKSRVLLKMISIKPGLQANNNFYKRVLRFGIRLSSFM